MSARAAAIVSVALFAVAATPALAGDDTGEVPVKTVVPTTAETADANADGKDSVLLVTSEDIMDPVAVPTPVPATAPVLTGQEVRRLKKQLVEAGGRTAVLTSALDERRVTVKQSHDLLELVPVGRERVEAATFLYLRVTDSGQFHKTFDLFEPAHLVILGERLAELSQSLAKIHIEVVDDLGTELTNAQIMLCGQGPLSSPADLSVPAERHAEGCELRVTVDDVVVHHETFIPKASEYFARRVTVERH